MTTDLFAVDDLMSLRKWQAEIARLDREMDGLLQDTHEWRRATTILNEIQDHIFQELKGRHGKISPTDR